MLRFIVLGEIPGTNLSLSFAQVLLALGVFWGIILWGHELRHRQPAEPQRLEDIAL